MLLWSRETSRGEEREERKSDAKRSRGIERLALLVGFDKK